MPNGGRFALKNTPAQRAFRPRDGREELMGQIIQLTSASASPSNLAIRPSALTGESYNVTVSVPKLAGGKAAWSAASAV
jgi:hypothetical protein